MEEEGERIWRRKKREQKKGREKKRLGGGYEGGREEEEEDRWRERKSRDGRWLVMSGAQRHIHTF